MGLQFGRLRAIGPVKFFSGLWNILALAALSAVSAAAYYRVAIVSRAWAAVEGSTTIVTPPPLLLPLPVSLLYTAYPGARAGREGMRRWEGERCCCRGRRGAARARGAEARAGAGT